MTNKAYHTEELLSRINKVEAPPFLFTRIEGKLTPNEPSLPAKWSLAYLFLGVFFILINVLVVFNSTPNPTEDNQVIEFATGMSITTSNQLYYE